MILRSPALLSLCLATAAVLALPASGSAESDCHRLASPAPPRGPRTAIFVSDLHLGVGHDPDDPSNQPRWHPSEDFRWHAELSDFLHRIDQEEGGRTDLVLLGDALELWQSLSDEDCHHEALNKNLGCNEQEALGRAQRVLDQHSEVLATLRWFAGQGENRVTIVPGNHDVALAYPSVRSLLLTKIGAPPARLRIATEGYWWSADGKVLAEHGHQIDKDPNRFEGWPEHPFLEQGGVTYLQQPWGEQMVQEVFNRRERTYPVVDNLADELQGFRLALKAQRLAEKLSSVASLLRFLLFQTSWTQTLQGLGPNGATNPATNPDKYFDLDKLRSQYECTPERFVADSLPTSDPLFTELEDEIRSGRPVPSLKELADEEIFSLCAQRKIYNETAPEGRKLRECPTKSGLSGLGQALNDLLPGAKDKRLRSFLVCLREGLPATQRPTTFLTTYVYAHTHKEEEGRSPFAATDSWRPKIWNDGAWQRRVTPEQFRTIACRRGMKPEQALLKLVPEDLPGCYSFVRVRWREDAVDPEVDLLFWVQESGQPGRVLPNCPFKVDPACQPE